MQRKLSTFILPVLSWLERTIAIRKPITIPISAAHIAIIRVFLKPVRRYWYLASSMKSLLNLSAKLEPEALISLFLTITTWLEVV